MRVVPTQRVLTYGGVCGRECAAPERCAARLAHGWGSHLSNRPGAGTDLKRGVSAAALSSAAGAT